MEPESSGKLATDDRSAPGTRAGGVNEPTVEASHDPLRDDAPEQEKPGRIWSVIVGLAVVLTVGALGYFYVNRDAARETASAPATEQAPSPATKEVAAAPPPAAEPVRSPSAPQQVTSPATAAAPPAETPPPTPSTTAAPSASGGLSPPPGAAAQTPAPAQTRPPAEAQAPAQAQTQAPVQAPASSAPVESAAQPPREPDPLRNQPASLPADDVMFVQKPRVNIRAEPDRRGRVVGSATKGQQFKVVGRSGTWVQVEGDGRKGWIGGSLLGPQSP